MFMSHRKTCLLLGTVLAIVSLAAVSHAAGGKDQKEYTADLEITGGPRGPITSKVFSKDGKHRMEMTGATTIMRPDRKIMWLLMPGNLYMEVSLDLQKQDITTQMDDPTVKMDKEALGKEDVDGHPTRKYHVNMTRNGAKVGSGFIWEATDLGDFPVRFQNEEKTMTTTWKNLKLGAVADSLFEIPAGYKKMEMSMPMPGAAAPAPAPAPGAPMAPGASGGKAK